MEKNKESGIVINQIRLMRSHIEFVNMDGPQKYNLRLVSLTRFESADGKALDLFAGFDVMHGVEKPLFKFTCEFVARYTRRDDADMPWKEFSSAMALAHIIPYLREYVSNTTNRLPTPVLMLDPINTYNMIADFEERDKQAKEEASE
ncbi:MAG: hypothetical protein PHG30_06140 [Eubacteriales bacterium]|nr:hypothetical protein [Eubacteriales bacterium]